MTGTEMRAQTDDLAGFPRVLDFSSHFSGPLACRELVHLGADVVKVERPILGDGNRHLGRPLAGATDVHHTLNSGTRSVVVDSRGPGWRPFLEAALPWADVVIVGARPADAGKRQLDADSVVAVNPSIVYCAITGYGLDGPWAGFPAHGLQPDVMAGAVAVPSPDGRAPTIPDGYQAHGTALAGLWAAEGILAALLRRQRHGGAQFVHVSLWESALAWMWRRTQSLANGLPPRPGFQDLGPRYRAYTCRDGRALLVCPIERKFWRAFVDVVGLPADLGDRGDWSSGADHGAAYGDEEHLIAEALATRPAGEWEALLAAADVPASVVRDLAEVVDAPHTVAAGAFADVSHADGAVRVPIPPVSVTSIGAAGTDGPPSPAEAHRGRGARLRPAPALGADTSSFFRELGLDLSSSSSSANPHQIGDHR